MLPSLLLLGISSAAPTPQRSVPAPLQLSNDAVRVAFDGSTGELLDLVLLRSGGSSPDDYLKSGRHGGAVDHTAPPPPSPFCAQGSTGSWYIKTGGDAAIKTGWTGPPTDRCCRAKDASGKNCRWYKLKAACEVDLPHWRDVCLSCASDDKPVGCPTFAPPPAPEPSGSDG